MAYKSDHQPLERATVVHGLVNIVLAISIWYSRGVAGRSAAWRFWDDYLPFWFWPAVFFAVGILAIVGGRNQLLARLSFYWAGLLMWAWGFIMLYLWFVGEARDGIVGAIFLFYIGYLKGQISELALCVKKAKIQEEKVAEIVLENKPDARLD